MKKNNVTHPPIVYFVFKRPKTTYDFLDRFLKAGGSKVYIFADGPRHAKEKKLTDAVAAEIARFAKDHQALKLYPHFSPSNLGLKRNIVLGLNTVFQTEDSAIIVEDDCLPTPDFFRFAKAMLSRYARSPRVMSVNGMSVGGDYQGYSYGFTKYPQCWGWATWKRAWQLYDPSLADFTKQSWRNLAAQLGLSPLLSWYFASMLSLIKKGQINTWDFQWLYTHLVQGGLAVSPSVNLVSNLGFDQAATNTKVISSVANLTTSPLAAPYTHPKLLADNFSINRAIERNFYTNPIAILGLLRQYFYYLKGLYAPRA